MSPARATYDPDRSLEDRAIRAIAAAGGTVIDAGGARRFTKGLERYASLFAGVDYRTLDISAASQPDIVGDIHALPFEDDSVDAFLCRSVLEHVAAPWLAVAELHRTLRPGGLLLLTVPSTYPYHARSGGYGYPDLWRFLEDGLNQLLSAFCEVEMARRGGLATCLMHFVPPLNSRAALVGPPARRIDDFVERRRPRTTSAFLYAFARK